MKKIGLIGGMSWESTVVYYQCINQQIKEALGGLHSAECILYSVDFAPIEEAQRAGDWLLAAAILREAAESLVKAGAELILLCTNTMHKVFDAIVEGLSVPMLHIADATAMEICRQNLNQILLLGTRYTMEEDFYLDRLAGHGLEIQVPDLLERQEINRIIFEELCLGSLLESSRVYLKNIVDKYLKKGCQGTILGCTELGLLLMETPSSPPLFDSAIIHSQKAVELALG